jgi:hypothetical protein
MSILWVFVLALVLLIAYADRIGMVQMTRVENAIIIFLAIVLVAGTALEVAGRLP